MKISTLTFLFLLFFSSLYAQETSTELERRQAVHEQLTNAAPGQLAAALEEKRARLVEAISDGDLESALIMQQEVVEVMDQAIAIAGQHAPAKEAARMNSIREALSGLEFGMAGKEKAREADQLALEFLDLMNKTAR